MIYFASDQHFGLDTAARSSQEREKLFVQWLQAIEEDCQGLYLLGDLFDFWFEYHDVIPKGYVRLLGQLTRMVDSGIPVHCFSGNHDMWMRTYLTDEVGLQVHHEPQTLDLLGHAVHLGHGDGLGPGGNGYKRLKKAFKNPLLQTLFGALHPKSAFAIANGWSKKSRASKAYTHEFRGDREPLTIYTETVTCNIGGPKVAIFGHLHCATIHRITTQQAQAPPRAALIVTGEWIVNANYLTFNGDEFKLCDYNPNGNDRLIASIRMSDIQCPT